MKRAVKWNRPEPDKYGDAVRVSKCGRFRIQTMKMASGRNGYWNARAYELQTPDGKRLGKVLHDQLIDALDAAEYSNDPNWEPS